MGLTKLIRAGVTTSCRDHAVLGSIYQGNDCKGIETMKVAVTDYTFDALDVETEILAPLGCQVVGQKVGKDPRAPAAGDGRRLRHHAVRPGQRRGDRRDAEVPGDRPLRDRRRQRRPEAAAAKGIPVCNVPDYCIDEVADHALAMILDLTRKITANAGQGARRAVGGWRCRWSALFALKDMTVGVVGFGRIGREVAARLKAFKCKVLVFDPAVDAAVIRGRRLHAGQPRRVASHERPGDAALPEQRADAST